MSHKHRVPYKSSNPRAAGYLHWQQVKDVLQRVETLYLASAVLLPEHEDAASGAHIVAVEIRNQKENRVIKTRKPKQSPFCVFVEKE